MPLNRPVDFAQKLQPGRGDCSVDDAPIMPGAGALDQAAILPSA